jgi:hypothetical protein
MILSDPPKFQEISNPFGLIKTARRTPLKVTIFFTILIYGELSNVSDAHFLDPQIFSTRHFAIAASEINSSLTTVFSNHVWFLPNLLFKSIHSSNKPFGLRRATVALEVSAAALPLFIA